MVESVLCSNRFIALSDILDKIGIGSLVLAVQQLQARFCLFASLPREQLFERVDEDTIKNVSSLAGLIERSATLAVLPGTVERLGNFHCALSDPTGITYHLLLNEVRFLLETLNSDLKYKLFWVVQSNREFCVDPSHMIIKWSAILESMPECKLDVEQAHHAYAFDLNSASLFHAMRVVEHGLRRLARKLRVKLTHNKQPQAIETADWNKIIERAKSNAKDMRSRAKSGKTIAAIERYEHLLTICEHVKEHRNAVSHVRKSYNGPEALGALQRVQEFMEAVVGVL